MVVIWVIVLVMVRVKINITNFLWIAGTLSGDCIINIFGTSQISGGGVDDVKAMGDGVTINHYGMLTWMSDSNNINDAGGAASNFNNKNSTTPAMFNIKNDVTFAVADLTFTNESGAKLNKKESTGESNWSGIGFDNAGTVNVETGTLTLGDGDYDSIFTVSAGATLGFKTHCFRYYL